MKDSNKFKNITELPTGTFQVKFKVNGKDFQPYSNTLEEAIITRNDYYIKHNYRPAYLFVRMFDLSCISPRLEDGFQVNSRRLKDRKYMPRQFNSGVDANAFAIKWTKAYNAIAAIYNGKREVAFLEQIKKEQDHLKPFIQTGFCRDLWLESASEIFGQYIPEFFDDEMR
ncbi:hypothetical protein CAG54_10910 [Vibrio sp. V27_P1S3P104]|uniref:hypothetical protein n=1 Tax=unclassified Vibrio TaxID=2614977 RepID=UPI00137262E0|nr:MULTISPECIES: hypothetical protein [unclassified Vibrio]NAX34000.1 hypothetical protein [Vibrio sp. V29_P1S30P107]NAX38007.1 hypothetical protein [Vibrio sp. V27_P1S3P104]